MRVIVKSFATLREIFGGTGMLYLELPEGSTIEDLLEKLREQYGSKLDVGKLVGENPNVKILVNGREITYLNGLRTRLRDGDSVAFIPPVAGG